MRENLPVAYSAQDYNRYTAKSVRRFDDRMIGRLRTESWMMGPGRRRLVDVGTGTAQLLIQIARRPAFEQFELMGTDYFEDMVQQARASVAASRLQERIRIDHNDVHDLPYPDGFCEFVISRSTIHHWSDPVAAFREIHRILKPGGVAVIHEPRRNPHPKALEAFNEQRRSVGVPPANMEEKYTVEEVRAFLEQSGLSHDSLIFAPRRGPGSLGFEVRIAREQPRSRYLLAAVVGKAKMALTAW